MKTLRTTLILVFLSIIWNGANGQSILIDQGVQVEGLTCFPVFKKEKTYKYLPSRARLALENDLPKFSFSRYISDSKNQAIGGGLLHFLILYDTPTEQIAKAEKKLRDLYDDNEIKIVGPVSFDKGRYALVTSVLDSENDGIQSDMIASGEAPIFENSRIALSFDLKPQKADLLLENLKMATSDVSIMFELSFSGLTDNYEAKVEIDWEDFHKVKNFSGGGSLYFLSADIEKGMEELKKNNKINFTEVGEDANQEALVNAVYDKLIKILFEPVKPETIPEQDAFGLDNLIGDLIHPKGQLGSRRLFGLGANVAYKKREWKNEGKAVLNFKGRSTISRNHIITYNAGDLHKKYGNNAEIFQDINIGKDRFFEGRDILVGIDGELVNEFESMINAVTVMIKKEHENNSPTIQNLTIDKYSLKDSSKEEFSLFYRSKEKDYKKWSTFQYKTVWSLVGADTLYTEGWTETDVPMINLSLPFKREKIEFDGDFGKLTEKGLSRVSINFMYPFFGTTKTTSVRLRPTDNFDNKSIEITIPKNLIEPGVKYTITWQGSGDEKIEKERVYNGGYIFIDELPNDQ